MDVSLLPGEQIPPDASRLFRSRPTFTGSPEATKEGMPGVAYRWLEVDGPIKSEASPDRLHKLFGDLPAQLERLLRRFMAAAYRRRPREEEVRRYT